MTEKIRVLFLSANPVATGLLRLDEEVREIAEKIEAGGARNKFEWIQRHALRPSDLQRAFLQHQPHIVHFSSHWSRAEEIELEDSSGESRPVSTQALAALFRILKDNVRIVFLDACFSQSQVEAFKDIIDYTVGTNKAVGYQASVTFAAAFYRALAFGRSVKEAFELAQMELKLASISGEENKRGESGTRIGTSIDSREAGWQPQHTSYQDVTRTEASEVAGGERDLVSSSGSNWPLLVIREGVDAARPFLQQKDARHKDYLERLRSALAHLAAGTADEEERRIVRQSLFTGEIILEPPKGAEDEIDLLEASDATVPNESIYIGIDKVVVDTATYQRIQEQLYPSPPGIAPPLPALPSSLFIGRHGALNDIKGLLGVGELAPPAKSLVIVRGWPGVGKTALAGMTGRDPEVLKAFPGGVLWASLGTKPELMSVLATWGRALGTEDLLGAPTLNDATLRLAGLLHNKRMLLIVDNIWDTADGLPFIRARAGSECALLITTRLTSVAEGLTSSEGSIYVLPVLTEDSALMFLRLLAPSAVAQYPDECRELVRDLEYLPLALQLAGGLLRTETKLGYDVRDSIKSIRAGAYLIAELSPVDRAEGATIPTVAALLKRSTEQLDKQTRDCFAFLGAFAPKPATFDLAAMSALWDVADPRPIVRKLVGQGLLEPVGSGRFQMHALLIQHARSLLS